MLETQYRNKRAPTLSKTFTRKVDAMKWARDTEILIEQEVIN